MSDSDDIRRAKEGLRIRLKELERIYSQVMELMESGGKSKVIEYLSNEFNADPIEHGNDVLIGSQLIRFDSDGNFLGMSSDSGQPSIAVPKRSQDNCDSGDT